MNLRNIVSSNQFAVIVSSALFVGLIALFSLGFGAISLSPIDITLSLLGEGEKQTQLIVNKLRVPRMLLALCVGALMASAGAMTQGLFRNPLADPSLIGVSAGATAGASIVIVLLAGMSSPFTTLPLISLGAFIGSIISVLFVYRIATGEMGTSVTTMLLAGIGVTFVAASISSALEFVSNNDMLRQISLWKMGGIDTANMTKVALTSIVLACIIFVSPRYFSALNALLLGESEARHLGYDVRKIRGMIILLVAAAIGVSVSMAGSIAFIGLIVPHIIRMLVGPDHQLVIPLSACGGALLLIVADSFARTIIAPSELPIGLVTTAIGVPIFISLLRKRHHYGMH